MNFCLCGNSTCLCETSCTCIHRGCLCSECHDLRKKDTSKEFGLPFSKGEFTQSTSVTCKYEFSSRFPAPAQENYNPCSSSASESIKESELSIPEIELREKGSSNDTLIPTKQNILPAQDIDTNKSNQPELCPSEYFFRKSSFHKAKNEQEKQIYKAITFIEKQAVFSNDDSDSSSDEICVAKEAFHYLSPRSKYPQPKNNQSGSEKFCLDISSTSKQVELPSSRSSSSISILELPENEWDLSSQAEPHFTSDLSVAISSIKISPNQIDNLCLQRPESTTPTTIIGERTIYDASPGGSISPIQIITTNQTVLVSPSGELHHLPLQNSQPLQPQIPASNSTHVSQSSYSDKASSDSAVKVSSADVPPINIQNLDK